jgi:hypothetical protein
MQPKTCIVTASLFFDEGRPRQGSFNQTDSGIDDSWQTLKAADRKWYEE